MPSAVGFAHLARPLLVAESLRRRGHEVVFAYGGAHRQVLDDRGFECHPLPDVTVSPSDFGGNVYSLWTPELVEQCLRDEATLLARLRPHAVLADFRPTAALSSRLAGLPLVSLRNAYLSDAFDTAALLVDRERHPFRYQAARRFVRAIQSLQKRSLARHLAGAARRWGLSGFRSLYDFFAGDLDLLADLPGFFPLRPSPRSRFVGPLIWESAGTAESLPPPAAGITTLYATAGHTGDPALLELVVAAFAGVDSVRVIVTTGRIDPAPFQGRPGIHAFNFLPGSQAAEASAAVIHAGGNGTTYQCLRAGRPAVALPGNNDQEINARLLARHGAGLALRLRRTDPARLRAAVAHILEKPSYRSQAERFREQLRGLNAPETAAEAILSFLA
jgi:UDP:flavonoid glycosyltransferase YjiC (YdhE family)